MMISDRSRLTNIAKVRCTNEKLRRQKTPVRALVGRTATQGGAVRTGLAATACLRLATTFALAPWRE